MKKKTWILLLLPGGIALLFFLFFTQSGKNLLQKFGLGNAAAGLPKPAAMAGAAGAGGGGGGFFGGGGGDGGSSLGGLFSGLGNLLKAATGGLKDLFGKGNAASGQDLSQVFGTADSNKALGSALGFELANSDIFGNALTDINGLTSPMTPETAFGTPSQGNSDYFASLGYTGGTANGSFTPTLTNDPFAAYNASLFDEPLSFNGATPYESGYGIGVSPYSTESASSGFTDSLSNYGIGSTPYFSASPTFDAAEAFLSSMKSIISGLFSRSIFFSFICL